jgi:hypothetical protein
MGWTIRYSIPISFRRISPQINCPERLWDPPSPLFTAYGGSFRGIKRPGREDIHSPLSRVKVQNEWSRASVSLFTYTLREAARKLEASRLFICSTASICEWLQAFRRHREDVSILTFRCAYKVRFGPLKNVLHLAI